MLICQVKASTGKEQKEDSGDQGRVEGKGKTQGKQTLPVHRKQQTQRQGQQEGTRERENKAEEDLHEGTLFEKSFLETGSVKMFRNLSLACF